MHPFEICQILFKTKVTNANMLFVLFMGVQILDQIEKSLAFHHNYKFLIFAYCLGGNQLRCTIQMMDNERRILF
jgi:hypothetical protein